MLAKIILLVAIVAQAKNCPKRPVVIKKLNQVCDNLASTPKPVCGFYAPCGEGLECTKQPRKKPVCKPVVCSKRAVIIKKENELCDNLPDIPTPTCGFYAPCGEGLTCTQGFEAAICLPTACSKRAVIIKKENELCDNLPDIPTPTCGFYAPCGEGLTCTQGFEAAICLPTACSKRAVIIKKENELCDNPPDYPKPACGYYAPCGDGLVCANAFSAFKCIKA
jgi:hypothetical protein